MPDPTQQLLDQLRRDARRARATALAALLLSAVTLPAACMRATAAPATPGTDTILRVRGLVVVDDHGVERVVIGAPTPDPKGAGKRDAPLHGIVINGPDGGERGGYGTMGSANEAILTLDGAAGDEVFKVVANADAGASLFVMNKQGAVTALTTYRGGPELHLIDKSGTLHRQPAGTPDL